MNKPIRFGILGAARIAPRALIEPMKGNARAIAYGVAARDPERARAYAAEHSLMLVFDDYEALVKSRDIDAVYNALPPLRHADLTIAALAAGKPVLCEKPFAMNAAEARTMADAAAASGQVLMEAFHYRFHPMFAGVLAGVEKLGALRRIEAYFNIAIPRMPGELRYDPTVGGGALMDLGTYPVHWCRTVAGREASVVSAARRTMDGGADVFTQAELDFGGGLTAHLECAMDSATPRIELIVEGENGRLVARNPLAPQMGNLLTVTTADGETQESFTRAPTYAFQLEAFLDVLEGAPPLLTPADAVAQMAAIDAIRAKW